MNNLALLDLWNNDINDISAFSGMTVLHTFYLGQNRVSDISVLAGLTNLTWFDLHSNYITCIEPLVNNPGGGVDDYVNLYDNPLDSLSINIYIPQLQSQGVYVYY